VGTLDRVAEVSRAFGYPPGQAAWHTLVAHRRDIGGQETNVPEGLTAEREPQTERFIF